jgi:DNA-binding transcriptional ArsR family regulator
MNEKENEKELEKELKALANRRRLAIIRYLKKCHRASVSDIAEEIKLSFKSTSRHLGILAAVDVVQRDQQSLNVFYSLNPILRTATKHIVQMC